jgi:hypothetical protein
MNAILSFCLRYLLAPVAIGAGAFLYGHHVGGLDCQNATLKADEKANVAQDAKVEKAHTDDAKAVAQNTIRENTVREIYHDVPTVVDRPVYSNVCLDASGVQPLTVRHRPRTVDQPSAERW